MPHDASVLATGGQMSTSTSPRSAPRPRFGAFPPSRHAIADVLRRLPKIRGTLILFLGPAITLGVLFFVLPVVLTIAVSLTDMTTAKFGARASFIGLGNYAKMLASPWTVRILRNTAIYGVCILAFNIAFGLLISLLTTSVDKAVGSLFRAIWLLPRITPVVIYTMMWRYAAADAPAGIVNQFIASIGVEPRNWLTYAPWPFLIVCGGFVGASFGMIIFTSAIESIPPDYSMAARVDGASSLQIIHRITLPLIRWPLLFVTAYQTLSLLTSFEHVLLLTQGGPGLFGTDVWALYAYHHCVLQLCGAHPVRLRRSDGGSSGSRGHRCVNHLPACVSLQSNAWHA